MTTDNWMVNKLVDLQGRVHKCELELATVRALLTSVADMLVVAKAPAVNDGNLVAQKREQRMRAAFLGVGEGPEVG